MKKLLTLSFILLFSTRIFSVWNIGADYGNKNISAYDYKSNTTGTIWILEYNDRSKSYRIYHTNTEGKIVYRNFAKKEGAIIFMNKYNLVIERNDEHNWKKVK